MHWERQCVCTAGGSLEVCPSGIHHVEDLGGSVGQDRGHSLLNRMLPAGVRWMMLQCAVYSTNDSCHNKALLPEPLQPFTIHVSFQIHLSLSLYDCKMFAASCLLFFNGLCWVCRMCCPISLNGRPGKTGLPLSFVQGSLERVYRNIVMAVCLILLNTEFPLVLISFL